MFNARQIAKLAPALAAAMALPACRATPVEYVTAAAPTTAQAASSSATPAIKQTTYEGENQSKPAPSGEKPAETPKNPPSPNTTGELLPLDAQTAKPETVLPERVSLADLEALALQRNPTLARADARIGAARGTWVQVGLAPNPQIGYAGNEVGNEGRSGLQGGYISQEFVTAHKRQLNRAVANAEVERLQQQFAVQQRRLLTDVRRTFYDVLAAQRAIELAEELKQISGKAFETSQRLMKVGNASEVDVLQATIEADQASVMLANARNRHESAWKQLAAVVGDPGLTPRPLDGDLRAGVTPINWDQASQRLLAESPELSTAYSNLSKAQAALNRAFAERYPNWTGQAGAQYDNATQDSVANVQIALPLPIYNRNQGGIREAQAQVVAAQADISRIELSLQQRLAKAFEPYRNAQNQANIYAERLIPNAKKSYELGNRSYEAGETGFLALLSVQRTYFQTQVGYLEALRQLHDSAELIDGLLLSDNLQAE